MKYALIFCTGFMAVFAGFAFARWELNPALWGFEARTMFAFIATFVPGIATLLAALD